MVITNSWCASCETVLTAAEIEYAPITHPSVYVKLELKNGALAGFPELQEAMKQASAEKANVVILATTPDKFAENIGISLHPEIEYVSLPVPTLDGTELWLVAKGHKESVEKAVGFEKPIPSVLTFKGGRLHSPSANHPVVDRDSLMVLGEYQDIGGRLPHCTRCHQAVILEVFAS